MSFLAVIESIASMRYTREVPLIILHKLTNAIDFATPVLLQRILQSMDGPNSSRTDAATYATVSLVVRLAASQSAVFNLWFSRRSYERARGGLILVLSDKILQRKNASVDTQTCEESNSNNIHNKKQLQDQGTLSRYLDLSRFSKLCSGRKSNLLAHTLREVAPAASLGKILNIMR